MRDLSSGYSVEELDPRDVRGAAAELAEVLIDCVEGGASVSFMSGLTAEKARRFWTGVAEAADTDGRAVFVAIRERDRKIVGTVQMIPAGFENQPHRGEIAKMLVLRSERRQGLGAALMRSAEAAALRAGKTLLTLDTASADAERLYASLGWTCVGVIPDYALLPNGKPCATVFYFKMLGGERDRASSA
ncbi:MAG TPA: GNAT family N-acetyltransferase [Stellaceae bacterium]|nr:GNAT family N-acetyltransferase [Stellaceae bacterium]